MQVVGSTEKIIKDFLEKYFISKNIYLLIRQQVSLNSGRLWHLLDRLSNKIKRTFSSSLL